MRREKVVKITQAGRDHGKAFLLTEMPASQSERWAIRAFMALARSGLEIPEQDELEAMGMAGIAALGMKALTAISFDEAEPLLEEMFGCIQAVPEPKDPSAHRPLIEDDIEEPMTRLLLRKEVFELHTGFFGRAGRSGSTSETTSAQTSETP